MALTKLRLKWNRVGNSFEYVSFLAPRSGSRSASIYANILRIGNGVGGRITIDGTEIAAIRYPVRTKVSAKRWIEAKLIELELMPEALL